MSLQAASLYPGLGFCMAVYDGKVSKNFLEI